MVEQNLSAPGLSDPERVALGSPADWFRTTRDGRIENLMPPWGNQLTDAQIGGRGGVDLATVHQSG